MRDGAKRRSCKGQGSVEAPLLRVGGDVFQSLRLGPSYWVSGCVMVVVMVALPSWGWLVRPPSRRHGGREATWGERDQQTSGAEGASSRASFAGTAAQLPTMGSTGWASTFGGREDDEVPYASVVVGEGGLQGAGRPRSLEGRATECAVKGIVADSLASNATRLWSSSLAGAKPSSRSARGSSSVPQSSWPWAARSTTAGTVQPRARPP